ncbi:sporulation protein YunB [Shimazuella alba]|uniref:Sporulation protein YunB n=1 Tax=Shimazuella alba TaxID=2690964 RepID=A0A6I4VZZ4_9BACL|nr:sporulation protein YunB [Shimazuella alba]MXQ55515.1 sporulation protein YunB [Shimazuella alba]
MFRYRMRKKSKIYIVCFCVFALLFVSIWLVDRNVHPILVQIAKTEAKRLAQEAIVEGIEEQVKMGNQLNQVMSIQKDDQGNISFIQINPQVQAKIYQNTTNKIQESLKHLKDKPIEISLGQALDSNIFANYGPPLSVNLWPKGTVKVSLVPKLESQGINMVMVTLIAKIKTEMDLIIPFTEELLHVEVDYPIAQALVVGKVPNYYFYNDQGTVKQMPVPPVK